MNLKYTKILLFFHGGSKNRGCEAIVRSAIPLLKSDPHIKKLALASADPDSDQHLEGVDVIHLDSNSKIDKYSFSGMMNAFHFKVLKDETFGYRKIHESIIKLIPQYDIFISIGGDNYCYGEQPGIYEINRQIKKAGKKLALWGASIGEEDLSLEKIQDLKGFDLILARETLTKEVLKNAGIVNVKLVADGAFLLEKSELPLPTGWIEGKTIGFNFSPLVFKKNPDSKEAALNLIRYLLDTTDYTICFVPHVIIPGNNDFEMLTEFADHFKKDPRIILLPGNLDATEYKGYIARMKFFIGARTHATIAAYSSLVPTLVLGYSIKSKGISKDIFGEEKLVVDLRSLSDKDSLIEAFKKLAEDESDLKKTLEKRIPEIKIMAKSALSYLSEL